MSNYRMVTKTKEHMWKDAAGNFHKVSDMASDHIKNSMNFIHRNIGFDSTISGLSGRQWYGIFLNELKEREEPKHASVTIKNYFYNKAKGVSTLIVGDEVITVKKREGVEHDEYAAFTALVTKYVLGSQSAVQIEVEKLKFIGKE